MSFLGTLLTLDWLRACLFDSWVCTAANLQEALMAHTAARLTPFGRRLLVDRIEVLGWPVAHGAEAAGVSRQTAYGWL